MTVDFLTDPTFTARLMKFCIVGGSGVVIDFGITFVGKEHLRLNKYVANSLGFACAATSNYILNRIWTFSSTDPHIAGQYIRFIGFSLVGLAINNSIIYLLHGRKRRENDCCKMKVFDKPSAEAELCSDYAEAGNGRTSFNFYLVKLLATGVVTLWNFFMNYLFTF